MESVTRISTEYKHISTESKLTLTLSDRTASLVSQQEVQRHPCFHTHESKKIIISSK